MSYVRHLREATTELARHDTKVDADRWGPHKPLPSAEKRHPPAVLAVAKAGKGGEARLVKYKDTSIYLPPLVARVDVASMASAVAGSSFLLDASIIREPLASALSRPAKARRHSCSRTTNDLASAIETPRSVRHLQHPNPRSMRRGDVLASVIHQNHAALIYHTSVLPYILQSGRTFAAGLRRL